MAPLVRNLLRRSVFSAYRRSHLPSSSSAAIATRFCSSSTTTTHTDDESDADSFNPSSATPDSDFSTNPPPRVPFQRPLENGLEQGVYRAILVGKVGQRPIQKTLRSGRVVVLFSLGTGGIRNNRRPLEDEEPREYAERCSVQWHRISVYPAYLGELALNHVHPGSILYVEGNLETKVFSDPIMGLVKRIREIAVRQDGRLVFLGKDSNSGQTDQGELRSVGYY